MLHRSAVVNLLFPCQSHLSIETHIIPTGPAHLDPVLTGCGNDLATIKLQRRHAVLIFDRLEDAPGAQVPDLSEWWMGATITKGKKFQRTRTDLSKLPLTTWISSNWRHVTGPVCPKSVR